MEGVSLLALKELLGHKTLMMTLRYAHLMPSEGHTAVKLLDAPTEINYAKTIQSK